MTQPVMHIQVQENRHFNLDLEGSHQGWLLQPPAAMWRFSLTGPQGADHTKDLSAVAWSTLLFLGRIKFQPGSFKGSSVYHPSPTTEHKSDRDASSARGRAESLSITAIKPPPPTCFPAWNAGSSTRNVPCFYTATASPTAQPLPASASCMQSSQREHTPPKGGDGQR